MNIALIKNKKVENIAVFNSLQEATAILQMLNMDNAIEVNSSCDIGYTYENGVFTAPVTPPTETELKIQLLEAQVKSLTEQNEFLENCLIEMATIVYA